MVARAVYRGHRGRRAGAGGVSRTAVEHEQAQDKAITYGSTQDYIPTSISEDIYNLIRYCQLAKGIAIAHGDAGIGKTKAARQYS